MPAKTPKPALPKKSVRNRPAAFTETLAVPFSATLEVPTVSTPSISPRQRQTLVVGAWVVSCIGLGVVYGLILNSRVERVVMPGLPVAQAQVSVQPVVAPAISGKVELAPDAISVSGSGTAVKQASAGSPLSTGSLGLYQPALTGAALQPGFLPFGYPQGNVGTDGVR